MVAKIRLSSLSGAAVDLTEMFDAISNNIISKSALGRVYEGEGNKNFAALSKTVMELTGAFCFEDLFPFFGWIDNLTGLAAKLKSTCTALHNFFDQVIEEHQVSRSHDDKHEKKDLVDLLLHLQKDGGLGIELTHESIKGILLDMFIGGTDTTATTMEWAMAELVKNPREGNNNFAALSKTVMELTGVFSFEDLFPFFGWMDNLTGLAAKLKSTCTALHNFFDQVIEEHQVSRSHDDKHEKKDFVDLLLHLQKDGVLGIELTHESIKGILLDMFIGGIDTTATTMEWAMAELVKNHSMMRKAQEEVRRVVGEKSNIDETDINQMEYLKCIVKETLRGEDLDMSDAYVLVIRKKFPLRLVPVMHS
ncbi:hypothetical protein Q3G72_023557 [Acer saccharum]|nr:hypothetical protein Q3G72_023557 [Acer saccharum]